MTDRVEVGIGRAGMTKEELLVSRNRFNRMYVEYEKLASSDPKNASYYQILIEHCQMQSKALGARIEEIGQEAEAYR
jgi:hypothetical protein